MKPLTPKDASILALVAENPGMSVERLNRLVDLLADDREEVLAVAKVLLLNGASNGSVPSEQVKTSAEALRTWARGNRKLQPA